MSQRDRLNTFCQIVAVALLALASGLASGQAVPTAGRLADMQVGVDFSIANTDYTSGVYNLAQPTGIASWHGYGAYADVDLKYHYGLELGFHQLSGSDAVLSERTFLVGGRYVYPIRQRLAPYARVGVGRGVFNFAAQDASGQSYQIANLGYTVESFGGGIDLKLRPGLNIRVFDYEYQRWNNFPPKSLSPQVLSFGLAYHFHGPMSLRK